jgi:hypothetical protein
MSKTDIPTKSREAPPPNEPHETTPDFFECLDLAANAQESLVTWDVSSHARREQDRLSSAARAAKEVQGGY